ncbi:helix-turn-helix domain-containing protein [Wukongibacter sp. M2B1]|uniref:helix-turn-helix domain-containing protein n=1 Tax=Wukongibacter sp. M2B1 TaxID=3088895 RepID=UPI003D7A3B9D
MFIELRKFRKTFESAQNGDNSSLEEVLEMFKPIVYKNSFTKGEFDEDCFQELNIELLKCVENFKFNNVSDLHSYFQFE